MKPHRPARSHLLLLITLSLVLVALQAGPAAQVAAADEETVNYPPFECHEALDGYIYKEYIDPDGDVFWLWECVWGANFGWWWVLVGIGIDDDSDDTQWKRYYDSGVWQTIVQAGAGWDRFYDGLFVGAYELRGPSGSPISRIMATRLLIKKYSGGTWSTCSDTGWKQSPRAVSQWQYWVSYTTGAKCGTGTYRVSTAGRFLSAATGTWITNAWVQSGNVYLVAN
jgi:hypothetical protein